MPLKGETRDRKICAAQYACEFPKNHVIGTISAFTAGCRSSMPRNRERYHSFGATCSLFISGSSNLRTAESQK